MWSTILCFIFIVHILAPSEIKSKLCQYATPTKYIGYFYLSTGSTNIQPFQNTTQINNKDICNKNCKFNDKCHATSFDIQSKNCSFYNTTNLSISYNGKTQFSTWLPCNMSNGYQPHDRRCIGLWISYDDQFIRVYQYNFILNTISTEKECRNLCLQNQLCGFVNFNHDHCILVPKWPFFNLNITNVNNWKLQTWTCLDTFVDNLEIDTHVNQPNQEKCTGYWNISNRHYTLQSQDIIWLNFQTQSYNDCLEECNQHSHCFRAYYNVTYSMCVLYQIEKSDPMPYRNMTAIVFEWICVKNDSRYPPMNDDEKRYLRMGMNCYRIVNTKYLFIGMDECGKCSPIFKFTSCSRHHHSFDWTIKDSCFVNQSYWAFPTQTMLINDTDGQQLWNMTKIFTGLQVYWLAHLDYENLMRVNYLECRIFNAARSKQILKLNEIISRQDYQALRSIEPLPTFPRKPSKMSISASQEPFHSCKTKAACMDTLRWLQVYYFHGAGPTKKYFDIPYNFMIDENGNIYEARGWNYRCAAVASYNSETICIAFIGWFGVKKPGEKFLNSLKKLIKFAVDQEYISDDYKLYIQQDLVKSYIHYNFKIVIKNLYRYRGFIPEDCANISVFFISLNFIVVVIIGALFFLFFHFIFTFKKCCNKCRFLADSKNLNFHQIIPFNFNNTHENQNFHKDSDYNVIVYDRPKPIFGRRHLEIVKLIRLWFLNKYLNSSNLRFAGNAFGRFLNGFPHKLNNAIVLEANIKMDDSVESSNLNVIVCTIDISSATFLKGLIKCRSCVCQYFVIEHIDLTEVSLDTQITE